MGILMPTFELHDDNTKGSACHMLFNQPILEQYGDVDSEPTAKKPDQDEA
jgi:hypothetical protein